MKKVITLLFFTTGLFFQLLAIPQKPVPARLVNDFTNTLSPAQQQAMESKLVDFGNSTTTQIVVVITNSFEGNDKAMYAYSIGEQWGVGNAQFDNGIVVLLKPKTGTESGEVFIAPGYGLEAVIPDAIAKRIVEKEMIPSFRQGNYYEGIDKALNVLMELSLKEYTAQEYQQKVNQKESVGGFIFLIIIALFILLSFFSKAGRVRKSSLGGGSIPFWLLLSMMSSGSRSHGGSFGNFSSGGGSFGGFGGGSFGGGGAGGSW